MWWSYGLAYVFNRKYPNAYLLTLLCTDSLMVSYKSTYMSTPHPRICTYAIPMHNVVLCYHLRFMSSCKASLPFLITFSLFSVLLRDPQLARPRLPSRQTGTRVQYLHSHERTFSHVTVLTPFQVVDTLLLLMCHLCSHSLSLSTSVYFEDPSSPSLSPSSFLTSTLFLNPSNYPFPLPPIFSSLAQSLSHTPSLSSHLSLHYFAIVSPPVASPPPPPFPPRNPLPSHPPRRSMTP